MCRLWTIFWPWTSLHKLRWTLTQLHNSQSYKLRKELRSSLYLNVKMLEFRRLKGQSQLVRALSACMLFLFLWYAEYIHCLHTSTGVQVKPVLHVSNLGVQCSLESSHSRPITKDIGVQCSLPMGPKLPISFFPQCSSPVPSDSSHSEHQLTDHDTSSYTLQEDVSS